MMSKENNGVLLKRDEIISKQIICISKHEQNVKMTCLMNICLNKQLFEIDFELIWQLEEVLQTDSDNHKTWRQQKLMLSHDRSLSIKVRNRDSYLALVSRNFSFTCHLFVTWIMKNRKSSILRSRLLHLSLKSRR